MSPGRTLASLRTPDASGTRVLDKLPLVHATLSSSAILVVALTALGWSFPSVAAAQMANDHVPAYDAAFGQGINFGWYAGWTDADLARLSTGTPDGAVEGIGVNALRPGLFAHFLEEWGYDIRERTFESYAALGATENVVIMGFPSPQQLGPESWCEGVPSRLFRGMWEPIWDEGDGTPYNEANTYAAYVYKAVQVYGPHVRFYEIWNEPDIGDGPNNGWMSRDYEGNWFDNPIDPCELHIKAPVQAYVRLLRISYEVIKRLDPDSYVTVGGLGYASYLDNILRMTDEPTAGAITADYPLTGGAYFDALSIHVYPHFEEAIRDWNNDRRDWDWTRTSDRALDAFYDKMAAFDEVLVDYGYDGRTYPEKVILCTETNLPRRGFNQEGAALASPKMQRNYILKLLARAQEWGVTQVHPYQISDNRPAATATDEFDAMGFYRDIRNKPFSATERTSVGVAYATYGQLLRGATYDVPLTSALALPDGAEGVGFRLPSGRTAYLLWAETDEDGVEDNTLDYRLVGDLARGRHLSMMWDYNVTGQYRVANETITLSGEPTFLVDGEELGVVSGTHDSANGSGFVSHGSKLLVYPQPARAGTTLSLELPIAPYDWSVTVYDALGRRLSATTVPTAKSTRVASLSTRGFPPGHYRITAASGTAMQTGAFVLK